MVILPPLGACTLWYAIVLRLDQEFAGPGNYLNSHSSPKKRPGANDDLGVERMDLRRYESAGNASTEESWQASSCKLEGLCFNQGERSLTELIFHIVYVYDRATLDSATL